MDLQAVLSLYVLTGEELDCLMGGRSQLLRKDTECLQQPGFALLRYG